MRKADKEGSSTDLLLSKTVAVHEGRGRWSQYRLNRHGIVTAGFYSCRQITVVLMNMVHKDTAAGIGVPSMPSGCCTTTRAKIAHDGEVGQIRRDYQASRHGIRCKKRASRLNHHSESLDGLRKGGVGMGRRRRRHASR